MQAKVIRQFLNGAHLAMPGEVIDLSDGRARELENNRLVVPLRASRAPPTWWPDWHGETAVIVASGPSAVDAGVDQARGKARLIAVNSSWRLAPWADVLYANDFAWWEREDGVPGFAGLKLCGHQGIESRTAWQVRRVTVHEGHNRLLTAVPGELGWGGNSGFAAVNLAVQFGVARIVLVGFDMRVDRGLHWHGRHPQGLNNPAPANVNRWRRLLDDAAPVLEALGIEVINAAPDSALTRFPKRPLHEVIGAHPTLPPAQRAMSDHQRGGNQDPAELAWFLDQVGRLNVRRYLEIGSRNGDSFDAVMRKIGPGGYGLAIDIAENARCRDNLLRTVDELRRDGIECEAVFADSHHHLTPNQILRRQPFDMVFLDGDHRYDGVKADFDTYRKFAPVVALHDVGAPTGHQSDGAINGVGDFWRELSDKTGKLKTAECITPGSHMGIGLVYQPVPQPPPPVKLKPGDVPPIYIEIPAWGDYCRGVACQFTIPALLASLAASPFADATFMVHTDRQSDFEAAIGGRAKIRFVPMLPISPLPPALAGKPPALPKDWWIAFKQAHKDALRLTPRGAICTLLNADVIPSRECFSVIAERFATGAKAVVSVGIRTQIEDNEGPPIGATADELFRWIWGHRHHITEECIWGSGRSLHPTILFFPGDDGAVSMHCFHLTPMFIRKERDLKFFGTIDDDLLGQFQPSEIAYLTAGEVAFAEISPNWKTHPFGPALTVQSVLGFWKRRRMTALYQRNFRQPFRILGQQGGTHPAAASIIKELAR